MQTRHTMAELNALSAADFVRVIGPVFEHSPWIARETSPRRPFADTDELLNALCNTVRNAPDDQKLALIRAHPDLAGRMAELTAESSSEQAAAGLNRLTRKEQLELQNWLYREKFGFPFVICVRLNTKKGILEEFARRLQNSREQEIRAALEEIYKIAGLRLRDLLEE
jgi:2-oxo-4-hydroxy-4-carboxy-5-ureidoimidazoline decarboxylase